MESNIRRLRVEKHITQEQLAKSVGLSQQMISRMEKDRNKIQVKSLIDIADYFQVSTDMILGYMPEEGYAPEGMGQRNLSTVRPGSYDDKLQTAVYEILMGLNDYLNKANT